MSTRIDVENFRDQTNGKTGRNKTYYAYAQTIPVTENRNFRIKSDPKSKF